jgi:pimeloyl-ACP methyl ester carboxylesterase
MEAAMRRPARTMALLLAAIVITVSSSSCGSNAPASGALPGRALDGRELAACTISGSVPVQAEAAALCGTLEVPEDPSRPTGRRIGLRVAVVPAVAKVPAPDPLFVLAGGPGDASTQFFAWLPGFYTDVHATRDIVLVDQRGTGDSNPLVLAAMPDTAGLSDSEADARLAAWASDSLAALDADPRMYTSTLAADDLDAVRAALGYDKIDLYGTSYGGELAQYYLRQHEDRVRVAILDGTTPLDVPVLELMASTSQHALDLLLSRCVEDAGCHAAFPRVAEEWSAIKAAFSGGISITDPTTGEQGIATLASIGPSIHSALLTGAGAARLPLAIHLAFEGQWDQVSQLVPPSDASPSGGATLLMKDEILCSEAWARWDPAEVERDGGDSYAVPFVRSWAVGQATLCRYLPRGVVPANDAAPVQTDLPMLWIAGDGDPQDPPSNLAGVPAQAPGSMIVVMPAQEHVVGHLGCGPAVIAAFLDAGTADGLDTSCIADGAGQTFQLP